MPTILKLCVGIPKETQVTRQRKIIAVMDGECSLCGKGAQWIARYDGDDQVKIAPVQSTTGRALLQKAGLDPDDPDSWLVVDGDQFYTSLDATIHLAHLFGWPNKIITLLRFIPKNLRDRFYHTIARNRYKWFGRHKICDLPNPKLRAKLIN